MTTDEAQEHLRVLEEVGAMGRATYREALEEVVRAHDLLEGAESERESLRRERDRLLAEERLMVSHARRGADLAEVLRGFALGVEAMARAEVEVEPTRTPPAAEDV